MGCLAKEIRALETAEKMMARLTVPSGRDGMLLVGNWNHIEWTAGSRESFVTGLSV